MTTPQLSPPLRSGRMLIMGIDPGAKGAIALYDVEIKNIVAIHDMPTRTQTMATGKIRQRVCGENFRTLVDLYAPMLRGACIEDVASTPEDGPVGAFSFGFGTGVIHGVLIGLGIEIFLTKPAIWKSLLGLTSNKDLSRERAGKMFPAHVPAFRRKKDDGRAEACLLAFFGERIFGTQKMEAREV